MISKALSCGQSARTDSAATMNDSSVPLIQNRRASRAGRCAPQCRARYCPPAPPIAAAARSASRRSAADLSVDSSSTSATDVCNGRQRQAGLKMIAGA